MLKGDISNYRSLVFGFRCEGTLLKYKENNLIDKALNIFLGKNHRATLDKSILSLMSYLYWNTEYTVMLIIDKENYTREAKDFLSNLPFNQVLLVLSSVSEVTMKLYTGEISYYIDDDDSSRYKVQNRYAITSKELDKMLRKRRIRNF